MSHFSTSPAAGQAPGTVLIVLLRVMSSPESLESPEAAAAVAVPHADGNIVAVGNPSTLPSIHSA